MFRLASMLVGMVIMFPFFVSRSEASNQFEKREITVKEGKELVMVVLEAYGKTTSLPKFDLSYSEKSSTPRFYLYTGTWDNEGEGSVVTGHYYVDRQTGDVWQAALCEELKSPALEKVKSEIRRSIGLSEINYKKIRIDSPMC